MHDVLCVYEVQNILCMHICTCCTNQTVVVWERLECSVHCMCMLSVHMFVCCVHFNETVAHISACSCKVFTLLYSTFKYSPPLGNAPPLLMKCTVLTLLTCESSLIEVWPLSTLVSTIY